MRPDVKASRVAAEADPRQSLAAGSGSAAKARRGAVDADPAGLAVLFSRKVLSEEIGRFERQIASLKRRLESE